MIQREEDCGRGGDDPGTEGGDGVADRKLPGFAADAMAKRHEMCWYVVACWSAWAIEDNR